MVQTTLPLEWPRGASEEDYLISAANRAAFEHLTHWSRWPVPATILVGPPKSGRTMLGLLFVRRTGGQLLDDARHLDEPLLFHGWNRAQESRKPLLIVTDALPPRWDIRLPDLRSRLAATPHVEVHDPDDTLIGDLIVKLLGDRGIAVPPDLADYLVPRIERSYSMIQEIVDLLDRTMLMHRRRMTVPLARKALLQAGLIRPAESSLG